MDEDGFFEVAGAPGGFTTIKRSVFHELMERYSELAYVIAERPDPRAPQVGWHFSDCMNDSETRQHLSEDFASCRRWRTIGGVIHALLHQVGRKTHTGTLAEALRAHGQV